jgi:N-acyl-phosphatidylethanolamine-hydrolysing phospholipase D
VPAKTASSEPANTVNVAFDVTCTPAQHFTGRSINDRFKTLWASWVVEEPMVPNVDAISGRAPVKVYFAGDTGYRAVKDGQDEDTVPTCPAFKEIGARWNGFDFAMIPIG